MGVSKGYKYEVMIRCMTYNQSDYIGQALDSFTKQRTSFPFIIVLVDDASTDGQVDFLNSYLLSHFAIEQAYSTERASYYIAKHCENVNCNIACVFLKENHYLKRSKRPYIQEWINQSKYMTVCEGDDFWVDDSKIQCQYDFMESHPNCSMCFTATQTLLPNGRIVVSRRYKSDQNNCSIKDCISKGGSYARINSIMYRDSLLMPQPNWFSLSVGVSDLPLYLTLFTRGDVGYINQVTSCYRKNAIGSWTERNKTRTRKQIISATKMRLLFWDEVNRETKSKYRYMIFLRQIKDVLIGIRSIIHGF